MQFVFFGSSPFSVVVLEKLLQAKNCKITAVVTTPDKPAGRGLHLTPNPVKTFASQHNIPVVESTHLLEFDNSKTIGLVAAYGKIIPQSVLDKFNGQIFNIHPSLLPKYRGPSPLQQQILDGTETGVTLFQLDAQMDHGPIIAQVKDAILPDDTWLTLGHRLFSLGTDMFIELPKNQNWQPIPQNHSLATYTKKITREDGFLPWEDFNHQITSSNLQLDRKLLAYSGWPGVWTIDPTGHRLKLVSLNPPIIQSEGKSPKPWTNFPSSLV